METLLIFIIIAAIQMIAAYNKQKKEAAKKYTPPPEATKPIFEVEETEYEFESKYEPEPKHEPKPALEQELESDIKPVREVAHPHTMIAASAPPKEKKITKYQFDLKDPAHGILWAAILHEPRYKVKWKQR